MYDKMMTSDNDKPEEIMEQYSLRMPPSLWAAAKEKAGMIPLSAIIRKLIEKWLKGEVEVG